MKGDTGKRRNKGKYYCPKCKKEWTERPKSLYCQSCNIKLIGEPKLFSTEIELNRVLSYLINGGLLIHEQHGQESYYVVAYEKVFDQLLLFVKGGHATVRMESVRLVPWYDVIVQEQMRSTVGRYDSSKQCWCDIDTDINIDEILPHEKSVKDCLIEVCHRYKVAKDLLIEHGCADPENKINDRYNHLQHSYK